MKKRWGRGPLFTAGVLTLLSAVSAGLLVLGSEQPRVAYSKGQDAELLAHAEWYRIGPDEVVLLAPSAHGGLFVADLANYRWGRIDENENGVYIWAYGRDKIERIVEF